MLPFGQSVWLWRLDRGLTQGELARLSRISRPNLSAIERGQREVTLKTLRALAVALNIRPGLLADGVGPDSSRLPSTPSRAAMERIAKAVVGRISVRDKQEQVLVELLRLLMKHRVGTRGGKGLLRREKRATDQAWLLLCSRYPPEVVRSLLQRIQDRLNLHG